MNLKRAIMNGGVLLVSAAVGLMLCEVGVRLAFNPADYLSVTTVPDEILGMSVAPGSAGFDAWGFRNRHVPSTADVVAIGDSHTYGNTAAMEDSWPSVVARSTGMTVYNLAMGGYGPNQYHRLLTTRGLTLHPKWVLCGLYMGDDFENAFSITYGLDYWSDLRTGHWGKVNANIWDAAEASGAFKALRNWLSRESVIYRLVVHGAVLGTLKENVRFKQVERNEDPAVTSLVVNEKRIREAFRPIGIANRLDQRSREVREGMRITFYLLNEMDRVCREKGCRFAVVIIPTKESVFSEYLLNNRQVHLKDSLEKLITNERSARNELGEFLDRSGIPYVDTLPALRKSVSEELYARTTADMHPGRNGYRVIADAVTEFLQRGRSGSSASAFRFLGRPGPG